MNKEKLGKKFRAIREEAFPDQNKFIEKTGILPQIFQKWDAGTSWPRMDGLETALLACGWTLSRFIAALEADERGIEPTPTEQLVHDFTVIAQRDHETAAAILRILSRTSGEPKAPPHKRRK